MFLTEAEQETLGRFLGNVDVSDIEEDLGIEVSADSALTLLWGLRQASAPVGHPKLRPIVRKLAQKVSEGD